MAGVPPIQGNISYDFREAINALARSTADAATLAARWYDICNTTTPKDVTIELSSGESMTVPNLAKAIESLKKREGDIDATSVIVHGRNSGVDLVPAGIDVGTSGAKYADGTARNQHQYLTPYNAFYDAAYVSNSLTYHDSVSFLSLPRFIWFNDQSSLNDGGMHAIAIKPLPVSATLVKDRHDKKNVCLCAKFTLINADPNRTGIFIIHNDATEMAVGATVTLMPGQHADFLVWCWRGADVVNVMQL